MFFEEVIREDLTRLHDRRHSSRTRVGLDRHAVKSWTDMVAKSWPAWREISARHARNTHGNTERRYRWQQSRVRSLRVTLVDRVQFGYRMSAR